MIYIVVLYALLLELERFLFLVPFATEHKKMVKGGKYGGYF